MNNETPKFDLESEYLTLTNKTMSEVITWKRVPVIGDKAFMKLEEAQRHQLAEIFVSAPSRMDGQPICEWEAGVVVSNKSKVLDILTTDENSRPSARKINGGTKKRKTQPQVDPQAELCKT